MDGREYAHIVVELKLFCFVYHKVFSGVEVFVWPLLKFTYTVFSLISVWYPGTAIF